MALDMTNDITHNDIECILDELKIKKNLSKEDSFVVFYINHFLALEKKYIENIFKTKGDTEKTLSDLKRNKELIEKTSSFCCQNFNFDDIIDVLISLVSKKGNENFTLYENIILHSVKNHLYLIKTIIRKRCRIIRGDFKNVSYISSFKHIENKKEIKNFYHLTTKLINRLPAIHELKDKLYKDFVMKELIDYQKYWTENKIKTKILKLPIVEIQ